MGIPRLTQDLAPYAEVVCVGKPGLSSHREYACVERVVIDGPSLVYAIYNKLLAHEIVSSPAPQGVSPRYSDINAGVLHFLTTLESHCAKVTAIIFDGGLPESKRPTRLDRMEKLRLQLELYRNGCPKGSVSTIAKAPDIKTALWSDAPSPSSRKLVPIPPPFMVPSVVEYLRSSGWQDRVSVVPGEADGFCASTARIHDAGVITNDSDLGLYDLGSNATIIVLKSIEKKVTADGKGSSIIALSLRPDVIVKSLNVPSMVRFGFERLHDPSVSTSIISERTRQPLQPERMSHYEQFLALYTDSVPTGSIKLQYALDLLDPRTAELITDRGDSPSIYLVPLSEDPGRDSSWLYGAEVRQLAYSLLNSLFPMGGPGTIFEYARKGQRIAATEVALLNPSALVEKLEACHRTLKSHFSNLEDLTDPLVAWYMLAFQTVQNHKLVMDKAKLEPLNICRTIGLVPAAIQPTVAWDDIHAFANAQAVLYSLRMLKQIATYVIATHSSADVIDAQPKAVWEEYLPQLLNSLERLPPIEDLFLDIPNLRSRLANLDTEVKQVYVSQMMTLLGGIEETAQPERAVRDTRSPGSQREPQWKLTKRKRKKVKTPAPAHSSKPARNLNSFSALVGI